MKAFGPGLEPTGCIVDRPAEFTIDARAAGKGDLNLYAQVRCCRSLQPPLPWAGTLGRWRQVRGRGHGNITGLARLSWNQKNQSFKKLKNFVFSDDNLMNIFYQKCIIFFVLIILQLQDDLNKTVTSQVSFSSWCSLIPRS